MVNGSRRRTQSRRPRKGGGGKFGGIVWALLLLGAIFAFYQIPASPTAHGLWETLKSKSETVKEWATGTGEGIEKTNPLKGFLGGGTTGSTDAPTTKASLSAQEDKVDSLTVAAAKNVNYDRSEWRQWDNITSCWTVREQVIATQAKQDKTLTLLDKDKQRTNNIQDACYVTGGTWIDPYTAATFSNPEDLDIDHLIPLGYVAAHGGQSWTSTKKEDYANDYKEPGHLLAVSASANRSKGDKGPSEWKPTNKSDWCVYATDWTNVANSWSISITSADKTALKDMLATCPVK
jgi:hypothetical protein